MFYIRKCVLVTVLLEPWIKLFDILKDDTSCEIERKSGYGRSLCQAIWLANYTLYCDSIWAVLPVFLGENGCLWYSWPQDHMPVSLWLIHVVTSNCRTLQLCLVLIIYFPLPPMFIRISICFSIKMQNTTTLTTSYHLFPHPSYAYTNVHKGSFIETVDIYFSFAVVFFLLVFASILVSRNMIIPCFLFASFPLLK